MTVADYIPAGTRFMRLLTRSEIFRGKNGLWYVHCVCDCGAEKDVMCKNLRAGHTLSCGCYGRSIPKTGPVTHGLSRSPAWRSYYAMINRCTNPAADRYPNYGGRGVKICDRWLQGFEFFYADMGERPDEMTLDRYPDMNGNYEPGNCRWATNAQQVNNRRTNRRIEWRGDVKTVAEWAGVTGISIGNICNRLKLGWAIERALSEAPERGKNQFSRP